MPTSISNPASFSSVRTAFNTEGYGISTSFLAYAQGGAIVPATSEFNAIGAGTGGDPLQLSQFNGFSVPSQAAGVNLTNWTITNDPYRPGFGDLTGTYQLNSDGNAYYTGGVLFDTLQILSGDWKTDGSASSLYDARMGTLSDSGGTTSGSAFNTWLNLGTTREWSLTSPSAAPVFRSGLIEIRLVSTGSVLASATIDFYIDGS